jgi:hypothetical protein
MKIELCLAMAVLAGSAVMTAQDVPTLPPMKTGLWQNTVTNTMTGLQIPPEVAAKMQAMGRQMPGAAPRTTVTQSCVTPDKAQKSWSDMIGKNNCQFTNVHQSSTGMSGDVACTMAEGSSKGHIDAKYSSDEKVSGKVHMEVTTQRQTDPIVMDVVFESLYQGADCKGVSPDSPKVVH